MIPRARLGRWIRLLFPQLCLDSLGLTFHLIQARTQRGLESSPNLLLTLHIPPFSIPDPLGPPSPRARLVLGSLS